MSFLKKCSFFSNSCIFFAVLVACSGDKNQEKIVIGFSQCTSNDEWRKAQNEEFLTQAALYSDKEIEIILKDAEDSSQKQIEQIRELAQADIDILVVSPNEAEPLTEVVGEIYAQGIPVIVLDRNILSEKFTSYLGGNNVAVGRIAGEQAIDITPEHLIIEMTGLKGSTPAQQRSRGFRDALEEFGLSVDYTIHSDWTYISASELMDSLFKRVGEVDFIYAQNDEMASAIYDVSQQYGYEQILIGSDGLNYDGGGIDLVLNGKIQGTVFYPTGGDKAIQLAVDILEGKQVSKYNYFDTFFINKANAESLKLYSERIQDEQEKLLGQISRVNQISTALQKRNTTILIFTILSLLLLGTLGVAYYNIVMRNRANRNLEATNKLIEEKNKKISSQRDDLLLAIRKVEEVSEYQKTFFQNLSHDLKNNLTLLELETNEISKDYQGSNQHLHNLHYNIKKLQQTIFNLLEFKKIDSSTIEPEYEYGNVSNLVEEVTEHFLQQANQKNIKLKLSTPVVHCDFDGGIIETVFSNLLSNAIKYTIEGTISIAVEQKKEQVRITVSDTGIGIPQKDQDVIFQRYGKSVLTLEDKESHGIGLAHSLELMLLHEGYITVESTPGTGSVFTMQFPLKQRRVRDALFEPELQGNSLVKKVLIIEDNKQIRNHLKVILKDHFDTREADNGFSGIELAKDWKPNLIISDIIMPEMDGLEMMMKLKENTVTNHIPIVLLTSDQTRGTITNAYNIGADDYITKPFAKDVIISRIHNLIQRNEQARTNLFFTSAEQITDEHTEFMNQVVELVINHIQEEDYTINDLAADLNMSRTSFYHRIKELTDLTPVAFIRKIKLQKASELLKQSQLTVREVSWECGFSDTKYFSKQFKKEFGKNPSEY